MDIFMRGRGFSENLYIKYGFLPPPPGRSERRRNDIQKLSLLKKILFLDCIQKLKLFIDFENHFNYKFAARQNMFVAAATAAIFVAVLLFSGGAGAFSLRTFSVSPSGGAPPPPPQNNIQYFEYTAGAPTYTIISFMTSQTEDLIEEIKKNNINYVFMDMSLYTMEEIMELLQHYAGAEAALEDFTPDDALVFLEDKEYIGGHFEMYDVIFRASMPNYDDMWRDY